MEGNYGFDDQLAVLKWVTKNIKNFGGDPSRITIGGQSAGAQSVLAHLSSPRSRAYFQQAIMESAPLGLPFHINTTAATVASDFIEAVGCNSSSSTLECLRSAPLKTILSAQATAESEDFSDYELFRDYEAYNPTVTGPGDIEPGALPFQPFLALGNSSLYPPSEAKPLLAGSNLNDALLFLYLLFPLPVGPFATSNFLNKVYGDTDGVFVESYYPWSFPDGRVSMSKATTDMLFFCALRNMTRSGPYAGSYRGATPSVGAPPAYLYRFSHVPSYTTDDTYAPECKSHVCHGAELRFVFGDFTGITPTAQEAALSETMRGYWINFIKQGNPNGAGLPSWPAYDAQKDETQVFQEDGSAAPASEKESDLCDEVWDQIGYLRRHMTK